LSLSASEWFRDSVKKTVYGLFFSQAEWMKDIYFPPWCRAGPYFVGVLLGFVLFRVNGKLKIHPVSASLSVDMQISFVVVFCPSLFFTIN